MCISKMINIGIHLLILCFLINLFLIIIYFFNFIKKYFFTKEVDLKKTYGENTWVMITGCSSGQGKYISLEFAKRNFNLILVGNAKIKLLEKEIREKYNVKTILIITNFCNAHKKNYFNKFKRVLEKLPPNEELSILVNNIGHRTAWNPYHEMPEKKINDTIVCGTIVQSRLTQIAIQQFIKRKNKSAIINITAMCQINNFWFGTTNEITVPYMSVYEGANAFGFYHSNSIQSEYKDIIDVLNITPGAVITEKTQYLTNQPFSVPCSVFVRNIITLLGNYTGPQYAYWGHELSSILVNFMTKYHKDKILLGVGKTISHNYMLDYNFF